MVSRKIKILAEKKNSILVKRQAVFTTALLQQDLLACNTQSEPVAHVVAAEKRCFRCLVGTAQALYRCKMCLQYTEDGRCCACSCNRKEVHSLGAQALYRCKMCQQYTEYARCCACRCSTQKVLFGATGAFQMKQVQRVIFDAIGASITMGVFLVQQVIFRCNRCFLGAIGAFQVQKVVFRCNRWLQYRIGAR